MTILELHQPLAMSTPKGDGHALFLLDYGAEGHLLWVVVLDQSGEIWACRNPEVRVKGNWSLGAPRTGGQNGTSLGRIGQESSGTET